MIWNPKHSSAVITMFFWAVQISNVRLHSLLYFFSLHFIWVRTGRMIKLRYLNNPTCHLPISSEIIFPTSTMMPSEFDTSSSLNSVENESPRIGRTLLWDKGTQDSLNASKCSIFINKVLLWNPISHKSDLGELFVWFFRVKPSVWKIPCLIGSKWMSNLWKMIRRNYRLNLVQNLKVKKRNRKEILNHLTDFPTLLRQRTV